MKLVIKKSHDLVQRGSKFVCRRCKAAVRLDKNDYVVQEDRPVLRGRCVRVERRTR